MSIMSNKRQLSVIMTGTAVAFMIMPITAKSEATTAAGMVTLHRGATAQQYEAFNNHFIDKFKNIRPTIDDAKDLWVVWAKDNHIPDSEEIPEVSLTPGDDYTGEPLFVPEVDGQHSQIYSALGIPRDRKEIISNAIDAVGFGNTISHLMSEVSHVARSHAELVLIGFYIGQRIEARKHKGHKIPQDVTRILNRTEDGRKLLNVLIASL